ncbi:MAG: hypothetical protein FJ086_12545, partial [Deltaproteobacteria bacterium]|nr:hypothetical protein [Deltaproteobacteria bacterium]
MGPRRTRLRSSFLVTSARLVVAAGALHAASRGLPAAAHTIALDGRFDDWAPVFAQPEQVSVDGNASLTGASCHPTNPDRDCVTISGQGRGVVRVASTWDATHVYFCVGRSPDYEKIAHCAFVLDLEADGLAEASDRVLDVTWSGGGATTLKGADLLDYVPSAPAGDPLTCAAPLHCPAPGAMGLADGYTLRGTEGTTRWSESNVPGAAATGDRMEIRVPWSALGVPPGTGMLWHLAVAQGGKVSSAMDNVGGPDGKAGRVGVFAVDVTPDREGVAASPGTVTFCHDVQNRGQFRDRYNVRVLSTAGASVAVHLDSTGRCSTGPADAVDANGDGYFLVPGDVRAPTARDTDGDGAPEVELPGDGAATWVTTLTFPTAFHGAVDVTSHEARSFTRPALSARALDTARMGPLALGGDL